jgi:hypothetical protein
MTYLVLELQSTWANFVRAYYISAMLSAKTKAAHRIATNQVIASVDQAIGLAVRLWHPTAVPDASGRWHRRDEPTWHDPNILFRLAATYAFSHSADIQAALSMQSRAFIDLPVVRNFFGHRNQATRDAALAVGLQYGISGLKSPSQLLASRPLGRPQSLILDWIDDITATVQLLCHP